MMMVDPMTYNENEDNKVESEFTTGLDIEVKKQNISNIGNNYKDQDKFKIVIKKQKENVMEKIENKKDFFKKNVLDKEIKHIKIGKTDLHKYENATNENINKVEEKEEVSNEKTKQIKFEKTYLHKYGNAINKNNNEPEREQKKENKERKSGIESDKKDRIKTKKEEATWDDVFDKEMDFDIAFADFIMDASDSKMKNVHEKETLLGDTNNKTRDKQENNDDNNSNNDGDEEIINRIEMLVENNSETELMKIAQLVSLDTEDIIKRIKTYNAKKSGKQIEYKCRKDKSQAFTLGELYIRGMQKLDQFNMLIEGDESSHVELAMSMQEFMKQVSLEMSIEERKGRLEVFSDILEDNADQVLGLSMLENEKEKIKSDSSSEHNPKSLKEYLKLLSRDSTKKLEKLNQIFLRKINKATSTENNGAKKTTIKLT